VTSFRSWMRYMWPTLVLLAVVIAATLGVFRWQARRCEAKGGHEVAAYRSQICVSDDGRVIEP
jgi:hypothetical protein